MTWMLLAFLWTFLFWASDPNYPEKLLPGRILFPLYSLLIYVVNLLLLWRIRRCDGNLYSPAPPTKEGKLTTNDRG